MSLELTLKALEEIAKNPKEAVKNYKQQTGNKVIGCFPVHCPEELVHASGMLPVGMWGGHTELERSKQYFPAFACSIMQSCMEYALKGTYDDLSAVIIPGMCDTLICTGQNWKTAVPHIPYISLVHPQNRKIQAGIDYLKDEYLNMTEILEKISGKVVTNKSLNESIDLYNEHRKTMRKFVEIASEYPQTITPYRRHIVIRSGFYMDKKVHTETVESIIASLVSMPKEVSTHKKVLLSGILADSKELLAVLHKNGLQVVADDLAQESRQFRQDVPSGEDAIDRLAKYWSAFEGCSLAYDPEKKRADMILEDVKKKNADGVIFCMMKFCDPEEYDYPIMKGAVDGAGIPNLFIEIDQQTGVDEQIGTRIQTFAEILELR